MSCFCCQGRPQSSSNQGLPQYPATTGFLSILQPWQPCAPFISCNPGGASISCNLGRTLCPATSPQQFRLPCNQGSMGHPQYFGTRSGLPYCSATMGRPYSILQSRKPPISCNRGGGGRLRYILGNLGRPHHAAFHSERCTHHPAATRGIQ
jgi:hypothetical protein